MHPFRPLSQVTGADEVSATHELIMDALGELLDATDGAVAATLLGRIQRTLPFHFRMEEERDGVFHWMVALKSDLGPRVDALIADHQLLLKEAAELRAHIRPDNRRDIPATLQLEAFAQHIRTHEREESMCMAEAQEVLDG